MIRPFVAWLIALSITGGASGCAALRKGQPSDLKGPVANIITRVGVEPKRFHHALKEKARVYFSLEQPALVTLRIYDEEDFLVRTIRSPKRLGKGRHELFWEGYDDAGRPVPNGLYLYVISAIDGHHKLHVYDVADETRGRPLKVTGGEVDPKTGAIRYSLPRAGRVRIRIGLKEGGPHLKTLLDWDLREAGDQEEPWDGLDQSGRIALRDHPDAQIGIRAYSLPDNSIIVSGYEGSQDSASLEKQGQRERRARQYPGTGQYLHAFHRRAICHEPRFSIELPADLPKTADGVPVVRGSVPLRIRLSPADQIHLIQARFELVLYVDTVFLLEEEEGYSPFTYLLDTSTIGPGPHLVTVGLLSFDDHIGVATEKIVVEP